jgi:hypothetical protein
MPWLLVFLDILLVIMLEATAFVCTRLITERLPALVGPAYHPIEFLFFRGWFCGAVALVVSESELYETVTSFLTASCIRLSLLWHHLFGHVILIAKKLDLTMKRGNAPPSNTSGGEVIVNGLLQLFTWRQLHEDLAIACPAPFLSLISCPWYTPASYPAPCSSSPYLYSYINSYTYTLTHPCLLYLSLIPTSFIPYLFHLPLLPPASEIPLASMQWEIRTSTSVFL